MAKRIEYSVPVLLQMQQRMAIKIRHATGVSVTCNVTAYDDRLRWIVKGNRDGLIKVARWMKSAGFVIPSGDARIVYSDVHKAHWFEVIAYD